MTDMDSVSKEDFNKVVLESEIPVLVDFSTDGCGPCELVLPILKEMQEEFEDKLKFFNHNVEFDDLVNDNNEIVKRFDVMGFPTLMVFKNGKAVESIIGVYDKDVIVERVLKVI